MDEWTDGRMDGWTDGRTAGWIDGWVDGCMPGRMHEWMDGWKVDGWVHGQVGGWECEWMCLVSAWKGGSRWSPDTPSLRWLGTQFFGRVMAGCSPVGENTEARVVPTLTAVPCPAHRRTGLCRRLEPEVRDASRGRQASPPGRAAEEGERPTPEQWDGATHALL